MRNVWLITGSAALLAAFLAGHWATKSHYVKKELAAALERDQEVFAFQKREWEIVGAWAQAAEVIKGQQKTRTVYVTKEIEKPVYLECKPDPDGWLLLDQARSEANGRSGAAPALPGDPRTD